MNMTKITLTIMIFLSFWGCAKIAEPAQVMSVNNTALNGYDPVAYHVSFKAVQADKTYVYTYDNVNWNFESESNMQMFKANPTAYIPEFSGFCAYELVEGDLVISDPEFWYIHNDKLYLFENEDNKQEWFRKIDSMLLKGVKAWSLVLHPLETQAEIEANVEATEEAEVLDAAAAHGDE